MVIINIGMPRSGTLWRYKIVRDLVIEAGGTDGAEIRNRYFLHPFYKELNAHIDTLSNRRLPVSMYPSLLGKTYVLNTHARPTNFVVRNLEKGRIKAIFGFRDPRDCILSMLDYSQKENPRFSSTQFKKLDSIEQAADLMDRYLKVWALWTALPHTHVTRYEDQLANYDSFVTGIVTYLDLSLSQEAIHSVVSQYLPMQPAADGQKTHFSKGVAHRYLSEFNPEQQAYLADRFGPYLERMGYES